MKQNFMKIASCRIVILAIGLSFVACDKDPVATNATKEIIEETEYDKLVKLLPTKSWVFNEKYSSSKQLYFVEPEYGYGWYYELNSSGKIRNTKRFTYEIQKNPFKLTATDEKGCTFSVGCQNSSLTSNEIVLSCKSLSNADYATGIYTSQDFTHKYGPMIEYNLFSGTIGDILWVFHPEGSSLHGDGKLCLYGSGDLVIEHGNGNKPREYAAPWWSFRFGSVSIDPRITSIGINAFKDNGVDCFDIEYGDDHLQSIGNYAFYGNTLSDIDLPNTLREIGNYAFYSEVEKEKGYSLSFWVKSNVEKIGDYAFYNNIMNNAKAKAEGKYYYLYLPDNCKEIGTHAFKGYINEIIIKEALTKLSEGAFVVTGEGGDLFFRHKTMDVKGPIVIDEQGNNVQGNWTLHVPKGTIDYYSKTYPWNTFGKIIADQYLIY